VLTRENLSKSGVSCKIYRIPKDEASVNALTDASGLPHSGRIFYDHETKEQLLYCKEYKIVKYYVNSLSPIDLAEIASKITHHDQFFASNDGPLLFVFKVKDHIFIQTMKECHSKFDELFKKDFEQVFHKPIESLFDQSIETSEWCYVFRYGIGVLSTECTDESKKIIFAGFLQCEIDNKSPLYRATCSGRLSDPLIMGWEDFNTHLSFPSEVISELNKPTHNFVSLAFEGGECQIFGSNYLYRVCALTGYKREELVDSTIDNHTTKFVKLVNSQFPPILNIFNLYVLCGIDTASFHLTIGGYKQHPSQKNFVIPTRGFYNYCAVLDRHPRDFLPLKPNVWHIRTAVRNIFLSGLTKPDKFVEKFKKFENILRVDVLHALDCANKDKELADKISSSLRMNIGGLDETNPLSSQIVAETTDVYGLFRLAKYCKRINVKEMTSQDILKTLTPADASAGVLPDSVTEATDAISPSDVKLKMVESEFVELSEDEGTPSHE